MVKICTICSNSDNILKLNKKPLNKLPEWTLLKKYTQFFQNDRLINLNNIKTYKQKEYTQKIKISLGKRYSNRLVFYFAASPLEENIFKKFPIYMNEKKAYKHFKNYGITYTNHNGDTIFYIKCPQNYLEKKLWYPHVHFMISNKSKIEWLPQLYTKLVICIVDKLYVKSAITANDTLILNTLPIKYYIEDRIPNSFTLPTNIIKKVKKEIIVRYIYDLTINNMQNINLIKYINKNKKNIYNIPIIVYCKNDRCDSAFTLLKYLFLIGFKNVKEYNNGIEGWKKK